MMDHSRKPLISNSWFVKIVAVSWQQTFVIFVLKNWLQVTFGVAVQSESLLCRPDWSAPPSLFLLCCPAFSLALSNLLCLLGWTWSLGPQHFTGILKITFHTSKGIPQQWKSESEQAKIKRFLVLLCRLLPESRTHIYCRSPDIKCSGFRAGLSTPNGPIKKIPHRGALLLAFWLIPEVAKVTTKINITVSYSIDGLILWNWSYRRQGLSHHVSVRNQIWVLWRSFRCS